MKIDYYKHYASTHKFVGYDEIKITSKTIGYFMNALLPHLPRSKKAQIVDIGCGNGRYLNILREIGYQNIYGVDISEEQVSYARERLGTDKVEVSDALKFIENKNQEYDAILIIDLLEHLELDYSIKLIRAVRNALKDNGIVIMQVPNSISPLSPYLYGDITHKRAYMTTSMNQSLLLGGFNEKDISHYALPPVPTGLMGSIRFLFWHLLFYPLISTYLFFTIGRYNRGIYTANMLTVAKKCPIDLHVTIDLPDAVI